MTKKKKKCVNPCPCKVFPSFYTKFPRYDEITCYLKLVAREHPNIVTLETIGMSNRGRNIDMVVLACDPLVRKHSVLIEGGIHAREWISHTTCLYIIDHVLRNTDILNYMDFYVIPCLNPDGYEYSHTCERLWRKNLNTNGRGNHHFWGVDLNRNFPFAFGREGSDCHPRDIKYRGPCALSEPESRSLALVFDRYGKFIKLFVSIHAFGNYILYPWGYTAKPLPDANDLHDCACEAKKAMIRAFGNNCFKVGNLATKMYISSGSSMDFARGGHKIKFCYTFELRKGGKSGFTPSPKVILKTAKECMVGIDAMIKYIHRYYYHVNANVECTSNPCK